MCVRLGLKVQSSGRGGVTHTQGGTDCRSKIRGRVKIRVKINQVFFFFFFFLSFCCTCALSVPDSYVCQTPTPGKTRQRGGGGGAKLTVKSQAVSLRGDDARLCKKTTAYVMLMVARRLADSRGGCNYIILYVDTDLMLHDAAQTGIVRRLHGHCAFH